MHSRNLAALDIIRVTKTLVPGGGEKKEASQNHCASSWIVPWNLLYNSASPSITHNSPQQSTQAWNPSRAGPRCTCGIWSIICRAPQTLAPHSRSRWRYDTVGTTGCTFCIQNMSTTRYKGIETKLDHLSTSAPTHQTLKLTLNINLALWHTRNY
jgi:hypothetical protein